MEKEGERKRKKGDKYAVPRFSPSSGSWVEIDGDGLKPHATSAGTFILFSLFILFFFDIDVGLRPTEYSVGKLFYSTLWFRMWELGLCSSDRVVVVGFGE